MDKVINILLSNLAICIYESILLGAIIVYFIKLKKKKKYAVEINTQQKDKAREEKLNQLLKNNLYSDKKDKDLEKNIPYEVSFHEEGINKNNKNDGIAVQIIEKGKLSTRKYIIYIYDEITIGQGPENDLVLNDLKVAKQQCQIFKKGQELYVYSLEEIHPVMLKRKKNVMQVAKQPVALLDKDYLELGETLLNLRIM